MARELRERLSMAIEVDADSIVDQLASVGTDAPVAFVIALDKACADWDVTLRLYDYFAAARKEYAKEHADDYPHGCSDEGCIDCHPQPSTPRPSPTGDGR